MDQNNLLENIVKYNNKSKPRLKEDIDKTRYYESAYALYEGPEITFNAFKSGVFPIKAIQNKRLKILTPK